MKIKMIPGPRNEELISIIKNAKASPEADIHELFDDMIDTYGEDTAYDALYYACDCGNEMLAVREAYFQNLLYSDEREYYVDTMLKDMYKENWLRAVISEIQKAIDNNSVYAAQYKTWHNDICKWQSVIFALNEHTDGWEYFFLDSEYNSIQDGIYDNPDATVEEVIRALFEEFDMPGDGTDVTHLDYEATLSRYETALFQYEAKPQTNKYTCCICGKPSYGYGNNPAPVNTDPAALCCDICNYSEVIPARIKLMQLRSKSSNPSDS